jgi:hypothetical protein
MNSFYGTPIALSIIAKIKAEVIMNINKSLKRTIKGIGISSALLFSFVLFSGTEVNAQWRQDRRDDRREERQERWEDRSDRRDDRRDARQDGYRDGLRLGREAMRRGIRINPINTREYRRAGGEDSRREQQAYRNGFLQGYREAYNRYNGNGRRY